MLRQCCYALLINVVVLLQVLQQIGTVEIILVACVHETIV